MTDSLTVVTAPRSERFSTDGSAMSCDADQAAVHHQARLVRRGHRQVHSGTVITTLSHSESPRMGRRTLLWAGAAFVAAQAVGSFHDSALAATRPELPAATRKRPKGVTFITTGTNNENNPQTDNAHRLRVLASSSGPIAPNADICSVNFATPYRYRRADGTTATLQPNVMIQAKGPYQFAVWISSAGYTIQCINTIGPSVSIDITVTVEPGVITV